MVDEHAAGTAGHCVEGKDVLVGVEGRMGGPRWCGGRLGIREAQPERRGVEVAVSRGAVDVEVLAEGGRREVATEGSCGGRAEQHGEGAPNCHFPKRGPHAARGFV